MPQDVMSIFVSSAMPASLRALLEGSLWGDWLGQGVSLSFSFAESMDSYRSDYHNHEWQSGYVLNSNERQAVTAALQCYSNVANIQFSIADETQGEQGDLRFAGSRVIDQAGYYGWAYYPGAYDEGGDVWFSNYWHQNNGNPASLTAGGYDFQTILHEIGHALGLKHSFEQPFALATDQDNWFYTVMSYSAAPGTTLLATTPMLYDIAAIQYLYGENHDYHSGDNAYGFNGGLQCVWDGGGQDCIDVSASSFAVTIDLHQGAFSSLNGNLAIKDFSIAYDTVIENAKGGTANDWLAGNETENDLEGGDGRDRLMGNGGDDLLLGGEDIDFLMGGMGNDVFAGGEGRDRIWLVQGGNDVVKINSTLEAGDLLYGFSGNARSHDHIDLDGLFDALAINSADRAGHLGFVMDNNGAELRLDLDGNGSLETLLCTFVAHKTLTDLTVQDDVIVGT